MTNINPENYTINFCLPLWGENFIYRYSNYVLPFQLASENLPAIYARATIKPNFHIYTMNNGEQIIRELDLFPMLNRYVRVQFHNISRLQENNQSKYHLLNRCHEDVVQRSLDKGAVIFLWPDIIVSNGAILYLYEKLMEGFQIILIGNLRVTEETITKVLDQMVTESDYPLELNGDQLCDLAVKHIHSRVKMTCTSSYVFDSSWPDCLYWRLPGKGMIQRGLFLVPMAMVAKQVIELGSITHDINPCIYQCYPHRETWHIVENARDFLAVGLSAEDEFKHMSKKVGIFNAMQVANWMLAHLSEQQVSLLNKKIRICSKKHDIALNELEKQSDDDIALIMQAYNVLSKYPKLAYETHLSTILSAHEPTWLSEIPPKVNRLLAALGDRPIVVYGRGEHTELLLRCTNLKQHVSAFSDSNPEMWGKKTLGLDCIPPEKINDIATDVLVSSKAYENEICQYLEKLFGQTIKIYSLYNDALTSTID